MGLSPTFIACSFFRLHYFRHTFVCVCDFFETSSYPDDVNSSKVIDLILRQRGLVSTRNVICLLKIHKREDIYHLQDSAESYTSTAAKSSITKTKNGQPSHNTYAYFTDQFRIMCEATYLSRHRQTDDGFFSEEHFSRKRIVHISFLLLRFIRRPQFQMAGSSYVPRGTTRALRKTEVSCLKRVARLSAQLSPKKS